MGVPCLGQALSGYAHPRTEAWAQVTARLLSPEGLLVAVCHTPSFHND